MTATSSSGPKPIGQLIAQAGELVQQSHCDKHGAYTARGFRVAHITGWTRCPACTREEQERKEQEEAKERADRERKRHESMLQATAIPRRFIGLTFDSFIADTPEKERVLAICRGYSANFEKHAGEGTGMVFSGPPGAGKSHLAAAILQSLLPRHVGAYITFRDMIRTFRDTWGKSGTSERDVLNHFGRLPLLVLDEIGTGYGTDAERTHLFDVIDMRYRDRMPMVLLTNLDTSGMVDVLGERAFDRIVETMKWVSFPWGSFRAQARKLDRA